MATRTYEVVLYREPESGNWVTFVPGLDGISTYGPTRDEALTNTREAIEGYLEACERDTSDTEGSEELQITSLEVELPTAATLDEFLLSSEDVITPEQSERIKRVQELFAHVPRSVDLAAELIAERREEARRETRE